MKTLLFSTLFPNCVQPQHGGFVENRLRHLLSSGEVETRVVAPVAWFPFKNGIFGKYATAAKIPHYEVRDDLNVYHPRYMLIPKVGMNMAPEAIFRAVLPHIKKLMANGFEFDLIDAHYFYPDGVAAVMLADAIGKPVVITARGSDLSLIPSFNKPRQKIIWAAQRANAIITVCQALKNVLLELGIPDEKITVLRNGVDLEKFRPPENREQLRRRLGFSGKTVLSVGNLVELKGHHLIIEALLELKDVSLVVAGSGERQEFLQRLVSSLGLEDRVRFLGSVKHTELKDYYGAADMLVLASSREGWANVLLESMACGTPVVATKLWGTPEVVTAPESGLLIDERSVGAIAKGISALYSSYPDRVKTRLYAEQYSWEETTSGQLKLFQEMINA
ncbi:MAG: glycosyltransferase family 4 protein [Gammaproteobacteria bacterium]|nr:glycosyltransferase family 4 protein [Gammaproteobacteria bacterium]